MGWRIGMNGKEILRGFRAVKTFANKIINKSNNKSNNNNNNNNHICFSKPIFLESSLALDKKIFKNGSMEKEVRQLRRTGKQ